MVNRKKLRVVTTFSGIGMQERGIENTDLYDMELIATSEINSYAIVSYAAIHNGLNSQAMKSFSFPEKSEMISYLKSLNINYDYKNNQNYNWDGASIERIKKVYLACILSKNLGDIACVQRFPSCDILTFSFPCTDISRAGKQQGLNNTRSGLVYQILRILKNTEDKPRILLMENVANLVGKAYIANYLELNKEFENLGYACKYAVLDAKDFDTPQSRKRVFAIYALKSVISLKDFELPLGVETGLRLRDVLSANVAEKYRSQNANAPQEVIRLKDIVNNTTTFTKATAHQIGSIQKPATSMKWKNPSAGRIYDINALSPTIVASTGGNHQPLIYCSDNADGYIRRLTPEECFKLMGMSELDCIRCRDMGISDSQLYNQAGNGLVTNCITGIMKDLYPFV